MKQIHTFHIPVMGLSYTIDTPIRVAHYGIDSVVSIVDDELAERMRAFFCSSFNRPYIAITTKMYDFRANRITAYLNLLDELVKQKFTEFYNEIACNRQKLDNFLSMLPKTSGIGKSLRNYFVQNPESCPNGSHKEFLPGSIDVNIMTKVDKANYDNKTLLPFQYNDAHAALRGFANSTLNSSLVLSAGMNPSLYSYIATFKDFFPDEKGEFKKRIVLKVSDFRSAMVQGCFLAKKGIWVSEYRVESGLNCGGHAFATDGLLLGPIMEDFKNRRGELAATTYELLVRALCEKNFVIPMVKPRLRITVQGGVGTSEEHDFLLDYYNVDSVGWGSPFLLVPEATATDKATRKLLAQACESDLYRSDLSPLGVPFNTVLGTTNDFYKMQRIKAQKPGSSCPKKLLALNKEFGEEGICTASRKYQQIKLDEIESEQELLLPEIIKERSRAITVKACLCVGLANSAYVEKDIQIKGEKQGVVVCPGPNMAYFDKEVSLHQMVRHIYGYTSILADRYRPNMFIKELELYLNYLKNEAGRELHGAAKAQAKRWRLFKDNLLEGVSYYEAMFNGTVPFGCDKDFIIGKLAEYKTGIQGIVLPEG
ncbi:hypothetical protein AAEO56_06150 [Flavobacterium sp. DGU11]|uniref:Uncharacterized protein n=1 Tax=Flavobacterium arundinis TaxID=3139143 RepID=A0ABU9HUL6_9FLAO